MTIEALHQLFLEFPNICTDTRKITDSCIFFALKGDNFNGNTYAQEALKKGASYAVVDEKLTDHHDNIIVVKDVLTTLQQLAQRHRDYCKATVIALTGSNGKTTTKELIAAVLSTEFKTIATKGNLNNHIGVPLTLLTITPETDIAIVEMGANHPKEIEFLCNLAKPDYGYITNFGKAHLEGFGSVEGVIKAKGELYDYLILNKKHIFFNGDDPIQTNRLHSYPHKSGYSDNKQYYPITFIDADPFVRLTVENLTIQTQLVGRYNFTNCCAAILIGHYFKLKLDLIKQGIENYSPQNNRSQIIEKDGYQIVLDAYNANPTSMKLALENFKELKASNKVVFLGDMFELGSSSEKEHQELSDLAISMNFDALFLVGENFNKTQNSLTKYRSFDELAQYLKATKLEKSTILIKGSRGMALERILELL